MTARTHRARLTPGGSIPSVRFLFLAFSLFLAGPASAADSPLISELFYDAVGSDDGLSFVEIWGDPGTSLDGFLLEGVNGSNGAVGPVVTLSGVIPSDGLFVVGDERSDGTSDVFGVDQLANFDFQNGPDSVVLSDSGGVLDAVGYGVFDIDEIFAGEGASAPDVSAGSSLARFFADVDSGDNALDFGELLVPTPGVATFSSVPEPGTSVLMATSVAGLVWFGRDRRNLPAR